MLSQFIASLKKVVLHVSGLSHKPACIPPALEINHFVDTNLKSTLHQFLLYLGVQVAYMLP